MKLHFYSDPGHGWLKVPRKLLLQMGVITQISPYSYESEDAVFLEEDRDASLFIEAAKQLGVTVEPIFHSTDRVSKIRNYWHFALRQGEGS